MIVYVASYPRSGNSWLRNILGLNWRYLTTSGYYEDWAALRKNCSRYDLKDISDAGEIGIDGNVVSENLLAAYINPVTGEKRPYLRPGCLQWLTEEKRAYLAANTNIFFIKTHEKPFERYFPGERVLQVVRHPIATIWSHFVFHQNFNDPNDPPVSLEDAIVGTVKFGSWSDYYSAWSREGLNLTTDYLCVCYEDLHERELAVASLIGHGLGLGDAHAHDFFDSSQRRNPTRYPSGRPDTWKEKISPDNAYMAWILHSDVAESYGYSSPVPDLGCPVKELSENFLRRIPDRLRRVVSQLHESRCETWRYRQEILKVEEDSKSRLDLIHKYEIMMKEKEEDSQARLDLIHKHEARIRELEALISDKESWIAEIKKKLHL